MKIIGLGVLHAFVAKHADTRSWIENWICDVQGSQWTSTQDIKRRYPSASFLPQRVVIFNVRGNDYRLEVQVAFSSAVVAVKWIGTHAQYDRR